MIFTAEDLQKNTIALYYETIDKIVDSIRNNYKYPCSIASRNKTGEPYKPSVEEAYKDVKIESKEELELLIEKGVMPTLLVGSKSQILVPSSTNFCIDEYIAAGITDAKKIIQLVDEGISPRYLNDFIVSKTKETMQSNKGKEIIIAIKEFYGEKFNPEKEIEYVYLFNLRAAH